MLRINRISKTFNQNTVNEKIALSNVNLTLNDGDFVTVIGGNGAGKSTLQNIIAGVYLPDSGTVEINGQNITTLPEYKRAKYIGRVFQDPMLGTASNMQIEENLTLAYRRGEKRGFTWMINKQKREFFREKIAHLGLSLEDRLETKVGLLSGGQRQAITLLMATIKKPDLLLLDEHTAALDPRTAKVVLDLTREIVEEMKITTLMITHNMRDAINMGNRLIMMDGGRIVYDVSGEEKKNLTIETLLKKFESAEDSASDRMILGSV